MLASGRRLVNSTPAAPEHAVENRPDARGVAGNLGAGLANGSIKATDLGKLIRDRSVTNNNLSRRQLICFGVATLSQLACSHRVNTYYSLSRDKRWKVIAGTEGIGTKLHLHIYLLADGRERTIYSDTGDWYPPFLVAYWSPDAKLLGVYATNPVGAPPHALVVCGAQINHYRA